VVIEFLDFREFLRRYDRKTTLFYLDPPYWGCESDYGKGLFARADFDDLSAVLRALKGRFILSIIRRAGGPRPVLLGHDGAGDNDIHGGPEEGQDSRS